MLYLTKKLSQAYDNLKDIIDEEKDLKIYAIPLGYETIKIDINKTFEDLKYISSSDKDFYLLEFTAPETLKKFTELPLNDWKRIFLIFLEKMDILFIQKI